MEGIIKEERGSKEKKTAQDEAKILKQKIRLFKNCMNDFKKVISNYITDIVTTIDNTVPSVKEESSKEFLSNVFLSESAKQRTVE